MNSLRKGAQDYLSLRRQLGFQFEQQGRMLIQFILWMEDRKELLLTAEAAMSWAKKPSGSQSSHWARRLGIVRQFAQYWKAVDPRTEIPSREIFPYSYKRRLPYIYRQEEITQLLQACLTLRPKQGLRKHTYHAFLGLIAVTGLRISEGIALNRTDVDLAQGILTIRNTKFRKSRCVPVHPSTVGVLSRYTGLRDTFDRNHHTPAFFISDQKTRLTKDAARWTFVRLSKEIGLRKPLDRHGPRIHDLRHSFAVHALEGWYRQGLNVEQHLPILSTYLGHVHPTDTYWYLSATPELLGLAGTRLEAHLGELS